MSDIGMYIPTAMMDIMTSVKYDFNIDISDKQFSLISLITLSLYLTLIRLAISSNDDC